MKNVTALEKVTHQLTRQTQHPVSPRFKHRTLIAMKEEHTMTHKNRKRKGEHRAQSHGEQHLGVLGEDHVRFERTAQKLKHELKLLFIYYSIFNTHDIL